MFSAFCRSYWFNQMETEMPQHIWLVRGHDRRFCDACEVQQIEKQGLWQPIVSSICPGDSRDSANRRKPKPNADGPTVKQLDPA